MSRSKRAFLVVLVIFFGAAAMQPARAVDVCGAVCDDTWTVADSPYIVTCDVTVAAGCTLTVEAGVEVRFHADTGLVIDGALNVHGIHDSVVVFTSAASTPDEGDWRGLELVGTSTNNIEYAHVRYGNEAIRVDDGASVILDHVTSHWSYMGLLIEGTGPPSVTATYCSFVNNLWAGVLVVVEAIPNDIRINQSQIHGNGHGQMSAQSPFGFEGRDEVIDARENWWGTADSAIISSGISDGPDQPGVDHPKIDWCPYLMSTGGPPRAVHCPDLQIDPGETFVMAATDLPWLLTSWMYVEPGGTLRIEPGVEVRAPCNAEGSLILRRVSIRVLGDLEVNGTPASPVLFHADNDPCWVGEWEGLSVRGEEGVAAVDHAVFEDAYSGIHTTNGATAVLNNVTSRFNNYGLWIQGGSSVTATDCVFTDNSEFGVTASYGAGGPPSSNLSYSAIHSNGQFDFSYNDMFSDASQAELIARNNWWGTTDPVAIRERIDDAVDDAGSGWVDWCEWLDGPGGTPVRAMHCPDPRVCDESDTWDQTDKPYVLTSDVTVCPTGTLSVGPGVEVRAMVDDPRLKITVEGALDVNGASATPATFLSDAGAPTAGDWIGFDLKSSSTSTIDHAEVRHATRAVHLYDTATATLNGLTLQDNTDGLFVYGSVDVTASNCSFTGNDRYGVYAQGAPTVSDPVVTISTSEIHGNGASHDFYLDGGFSAPVDTILMAANNWWGSSVPIFIADRIYDRSDSTANARVDWCRFLDGPGGEPNALNCLDTSVCNEVETLSRTDQPYLVLTNIDVCPTGTLRIEPGVELRFAEMSPTLRVHVEGTLDINGTESSPVLLTSDAETPAPEDWQGLYLTTGSSSHVEYATVDHATNAIHVNGTSATLDHVETTDSTRGVYVYGDSTVDINALTSRLNDDGLYVYHGNSTVTVTGSTLTDNNRYGVYLDGYSSTMAPQVSITGSSIHSNLGAYDVWTYRYASPGQQVIVARDNWWGNPDATAISSRIHDYREITSSPLVDFCGWLDGPGGGAVRDTECPDLAVCGETADWTVTARSYLLTSDLRICSTGTLNVGPGVEVRSALTSPTLDFVNHGILDVGGTAGSEVHFTSDADSPAAADWSGLYSYSGSSNTIEHATIDHAANAVFVNGTSATLDHVETTDSTRGVYVYGDSTVDINALTSRLNNDGLFVYHGNSTVTVTGSTLTDNNRYGVYLDGYSSTMAPQVSITGSSIHSNLSAYDVWTYRYASPGQQVIVARDNWWGNPDATAISSRIHDYREITSSPLVDFCGWLDGPGGAPVRDTECPDLAICGETADWTVTARPYLLTSDLRICSTGTLNVGPGVEVRSALTSPTLDFVNYGILDVGGTAGSEVHFTSDADSPAAADWSGLYSYNGSSNTIEHATIDHAANAVYVNDTSATLDHVETTDSTRGVYVYANSTVDINALTSRLNNDGLYVYRGNSTVTVTGSTLTDNNRYGVYLDGYSSTMAPQVSITGSSIHSNLGAYDVWTHRYASPGQQVIVARGNWWGNPDSTAISSRIHDYREITSSPLVDFCGWLNGAGGGAVRDAECPDLAICEETVDWTVTARPYLLTGDLRICPTGTLNVGPGVEVRSALTSPTLDFVNYGILNVSGTLGNEVRFTSDADSPSVADWSGLYSYSGSSSTIQHAKVDHASNAIQVNDTSATLDHVETTDSTRGVYVYGNSTVDINALTSRLNNDGLYVYRGNSTVTVTGSTLTDNNRYGVYLDGYSSTMAPQVNITGSSIHSNLGAYDVWTYRYASPGQQVIVARDNWWGTPDATAISSRIHDYREITSSPLVDFCGWLDDVGGAPVRDAECPDLAICGETADWTVTGRPYLLTSDLRICSTGTLNVGPGVEVRSALTSPTLDFVNYGILDVGGTAGSEVHFTSDADSPAAADWSGLYSYNGSSNTIEHATIDHAANAVHVNDTSALLDHVETTDSTRGVYVYANSTVDINALTSRLNNDGLYVYRGNSTVTVTGSTLTDNNRYGVYLDGYSSTMAPQVSITGSSIHSNFGAYDVYSYRYVNPGQQVILARENWWGTPDATAISSRIHDYREITSSPLVDFCGWLDDLGGAPVRDAECPDLAICGETADWTVTARPYLLTSDLRICSTGALNVGPGVEVRSALTSPTLDFVNYGILDVSGTAGNEVRFTSDADPPAVADWGGLNSYSGSSSTIEYAMVDHASNAVYVEGTSATLDHVETTDNTRGVYVYGNSTVDINALTSRLNNDGLYVYHGNSTVTVTGSTLTDNGRYGVNLDGYSGTLAPHVSINRSSIHSNLGSYDLYTYRYANPATSIVWATDNWWGTSDPVAIATRIYDRDDITSSPHVYYQAFGDVCDMALGRDGDRDGLPDFDDNCPAHSNASQLDSDGDLMGDPCDPEPGTAPWGACDGFEDDLDGYLDTDGDGWGDPCDHQPTRADSYPGALELCDGRDNDGDGLLAVDEQIDDDLDEGLACGDCEDLEPLANVCMCEMCNNLIDDDCDLATDGGDSECQAYATCVVLASGPDPGLTMHKGECAGATLSGPFDVIRGSLVQLQIASGSVDLGTVECVEGGLDWERVTDWSPAPRPFCEESPVLYFLARNAGDLDFGLASGGEPRDVMDPDPPCP